MTFMVLLPRGQVLGPCKDWVRVADFGGSSSPDSPKGPSNRDSEESGSCSRAAGNAAQWLCISYTISYIANSHVFWRATNHCQSASRRVLSRSTFTPLPWMTLHQLSTVRWCQLSHRTWSSISGLDFSTPQIRLWRMQYIVASSKVVSP